MSGLLHKMLTNDKIRYFLAGGCTTMVNIVVFFGLRTFTDLDRNTCNFTAIVSAILFAYIANKFFVFKKKADSLFEATEEFVSFVGARILSMGIEIIGFNLICDSFRLNELISKITVQLVVLVVNYLFSKLFVFNSNREPFLKWVKRNKGCVLAALISGLVVVIISIAQNVAPFGDNALTLVDSIHQYVPFFAEYYNKLANEGSMFYTWNLGLGSNFLSLMAYYLISPFNYLILFFGKDGIPTAITIVITLKIALSGFNFAYYLSQINTKKRSNNYYVVIFGVAYALSNYVIGYFWNIMWLDCVMILPLVILGFTKLMEEKNAKMFTVSLFYALYCNYYIGYIICLFLVLWFAVYNHKNIKKFIFDGVRFAIFSLIAGAMAAFVLIPAYFGIQATGSAKEKLPKFLLYGDVFEILKQHLAVTQPISNQSFDGGANLYCGVLAIVLIFMYLLNTKIKLWDKIGRLLLLAFLLLSFNETMLNFLWHGFHNQYGIPNRFSFVYIFVLLLMGYECLINIKYNRKFDIAISSIFAIVFVFLCDKYTSSAISNITLGVTLGLVIVYGIVISLQTNNIIKEKTFSIIIVTAATIEVVACGVYGFIDNGHVGTKQYLSDTKVIEKAVNELEAFDNDAAYSENISYYDNSVEEFYRVELANCKMLDESTWHNLRSIGTFCSTVRGDVTSVMNRLGFYTAANEYLYDGASPVSNALLGVKYIFVRPGDYFVANMRYRGTVDTVDIYENEYSLPIAYGANEDVLSWDSFGSASFNNLNKLVLLSTGVGDVYIKKNIQTVISGDNCIATIGENNSIKYSEANSNGFSYTVSFVVDEAGDYFAMCRGNNIRNIRVFVNGAKRGYDRFQSQILPLGNLMPDDNVALQYCYAASNELSGTGSFSIATLDQRNFEDFYNILNNNGMIVEEYDDGYVKGSITFDEPKLFMSSIPYDEGWRVKVDGKKIKANKWGDAFIAFELSEGTHTIEMLYYPYGLFLGIGISFVAWAVFILILTITNKKNKNNSKINT